MTRMGTRARSGDDYSDMLNDMYGRVYNLEQTVLSPAVAGNTFGEVIIDDGTNPPVTIDLVAAPPTGLVLTAGAFLDEIYIDATWTPPAGVTNIVAYDVSIERRISTGPDVYGPPTVFIAPGASHRFHALEPEQTYRIRVWSVNHAGVRSLTNISSTQLTIKDQTVPPAVTGVTIARGATSAVVYFTPLTAAQAPDVANGNGIYIIELHTNSGFSALLRTTRSTASVVQFGDLGTGGTTDTVWARVAPVDASGNQGPWAGSSSAVVGGLVESMIFGTISGAYITVNTLNGDRVITNTLQANAITTSSLTARTITLGSGGQMWAGAGSVGSGNGVLFNNQGIRMYTSGTPTVVLDAVSGTASFTGAISGGTITGSYFQTGTSGIRIVIDPTGPTPEMQLYSGWSGEFSPARIVADQQNSRPNAWLISPRAGSGYSSALMVVSSGTASFVPQATIRAEEWTLQHTNGNQIMRIESGMFRIKDFGNDTLFELASSSLATFVDDVVLWNDTGTQVLLGVHNSGAATIGCSGGQGLGLIVRNSANGAMGYNLWWSGTEERVFTQYGYYVHESGVSPGGSFSRAHDKCAYRAAQQPGAANNWVSVLGAVNFTNFFSGGFHLVDAGGGVIEWYCASSSGAATIPIAASAFNITSSAFLKENIETAVFEDRFDDIKVRSFNYRDEPSLVAEINDMELWKLNENESPLELERDLAGRASNPQLGFVVEELAEVFPELVGFDDWGNPQTINVNGVVALLVDQVQQLRSRLAVLEQN